jgi:FkbM family methyltransferase
MPDFFSVTYLKKNIAHPGFRRYFKNTGWMFFGQIFSLVAAFFVGAYVARYLGPKNFGLMSYAISFVSLFGFLAGFGADGILNREFVRQPEKKEELISAGFWLKLLGGLLAIAVVNIIGLITNADQLTRLLIFIFSLTFIGQSFTVITTYFQARVLSKKVVLVQLIVTLLSALIKLIFIYFHLSVIWLTAVYLLDSLNLAAGLIIIYRQGQKKFFRLNIDWSIFKSILRDSLPLMLTVVTITLYSKIDQIFLKQMIDDATVGIYSAAVKLSEVWYFIPGIICASLFPAIVNAKKDPLIYEKRLKKLFLLIFFLALVISLLVFFLARPLVDLLFGSSYGAAALILKIYIWSIIPTFLMTILHYYLLAENYTKIYFIITLTGAVANIGLNLKLIPLYGGAGSAGATVISYTLVPLLLFLFPQTRRPLISLLNLPSPLKTLRALKKIFGSRGVISKKYIARFLPANPIILEAGADTGSDTLEMIKLWPEAKIYAFEPLPASFQKLQELTSPYPDIHCYNSALSEKDGREIMYVSNTLSSSSLKEPKEHLRQHPEISFPDKLMVDTVTLDRWAETAGIKKIDFLWLDLQGMELAVLKAAETILSTVKVIQTEVSLLENYTGAPLYGELREYLLTRGFIVKKQKLPWKDMGNVLFIKKL